MASQKFGAVVTEEAMETLYLGIFDVNRAALANRRRASLQNGAVVSNATPGTGGSGGRSIL